VEALPTVAVDPFPVQFTIDGIDLRRSDGVRVRPRLAKAQEILPATLRTRPVAGRQGGLFVQEEELGEPARAQEFAAPPLELEPAGDPPPDLPRTDQSAVVVVKDTSVPEEEPPRLGGDDVSERGDTVAERHGTHIVRGA
jgi:hypothetical protein